MRRDWFRWLLGLRRPTVKPQALVGHVHNWDVCRTYGQYRYRICLNGCGERRGC